LDEETLLREWLRQASRRRQRGSSGLAAEKGIAASLRTVGAGAVTLACCAGGGGTGVRALETAAGRQLQIDFGERLVETGRRHGEGTRAAGLG
jgi:hypothetical protein